MGAGASSSSKRISPERSDAKGGSYAGSTACQQEVTYAESIQRNPSAPRRQTCTLYYIRCLTQPRGPTQHELDRKRLKELEEEVERANSDKKRFAMMLSETEAAFSQRKAELARLSREVMILKATLEAALTTTNSLGTSIPNSSSPSEVDVSVQQHQQLQEQHQQATERIKELEKQITALKGAVKAREDLDSLAYDVLDHYAFLKSSLPRLEEGASDALGGMDEAIDKFSSAWESLKQNEHALCDSS